MRRHVWRRVLVLVILGLVAIVLPRVLGWPHGGESVVLRAGLTAAWAVLSWAMIRGVRTAGLRQLRELPAERQGMLNMGMQLLTGALVVAAVAVAADIWHVSLTGAILGGALTGVVVGLAAQSTLGNVFAGLQLLSLRPLRVGEWVSMRLAGTDVTGRVEEINFFYTVLRDRNVRRVVPNGEVTVAPVTVDETQKAPVQQLVLPYRLAPDDARTMLAPLIRADVVELRADSYVLRVEWKGAEEDLAGRLARVAAHLKES